MIEVRGIHPIDGPEPVYLIDVAISGKFDDVDWGSITQAEPGQPQDNWQVPYDEQEIGPLADGRTRAVFFFHYLQLEKPLETSTGHVSLREPSPVPDDLASVEYLEP